MKRTAPRDRRDHGIHDHVIDLLIACPDLCLRKYRTVEGRMRDSAFRERWIRERNAAIANRRAVA